jgi:hypothetical protein
MSKQPETTDQIIHRLLQPVSSRGALSISEVENMLRQALVAGRRSALIEAARQTELLDES